MDRLPNGPEIVVGLVQKNQASYVAIIAGSLMADSTIRDSGGPQTPHGIGVGSTEAQLTVAYPDLVAPADGVYPSETGYALSDGAGHWIDFLIANDTHLIQEIVVSHENAVPSEFCG